MSGALHRRPRLRPSSSPLLQPSPSTGLLFALCANGAQGGTAADTVASTGLHNDGDWSCGWIDGADLAYSFTTDRPLALHARVSESSGETPSLTLVRAGCTPEVRVACGVSTLDVAELPAGSYFLWVDGLQEGWGDVSLSASLE